ncbi:50S ribosomal protein L27 [Candidatus Roizmanbacteria bacterium CG02_land_8_20_14_3_00_36_15]|uniref:Large ribosomal subunit protein bL27 n=2 Tax=Candidatus Roizmaniibacteriota TaxID=1752723 RepID=A0A2M8KMM7_9BACT|nr:MAG: 50S ribosomal protein L27 [Candidatus Roizmanbacteria bacterium CG03_land_8_20_14_0_80_36_21]PIV37622.1 MAG: 50S ribosomal protein L27 [Candidatus Roizmanbacteria bacterium CG02_land_8_20_14_3_00_36_15]PIY70212.1 MAG: 50S ribosomal protein L27 [Candidatus Roizmanbacteria bacterium CG_4_10_14_0_8_um_filter_36_36]PJA53064.1 MAG: 50S ribosomal protein L27 [Candidatus Roizmanbacteria bacterium CG_4_9_14_3_um_filter_36_11]PJC82096.1 MAG: 50S ribosomal protein L27 [Candidatus Roizmanbacteria 
MAHTKAQKAVKGNRDSRSKRLGVKIFGGQSVRPGNVIIRQRGTKVRAGEGVLLSKDKTLMALRNGTVKFSRKKGRQFVSVIST